MPALPEEDEARDRRSSMNAWGSGMGREWIQRVLCSGWSSKEFGGR